MVRGGLSERERKVKRIKCTGKGKNDEEKGYGVLFSLFEGR